MSKNNYRYKNDGTKLDTTKGCIARMGGRVLRNARKRLFYKGKKIRKEQNTISANRPTVRGSGKRMDRIVRKDWSFDDSYCRTSVSSTTTKETLDNNSGLDDASDSVGDDEDTTSETSIVMNKNTEKKVSNVW